MASELDEIPASASVVEPDKPMDVRDYLTFALTYKWVILGVSVIISGAVVLWTLRQPSIYEASCTIQYDPNPPRPLGEQVEDIGNPIGHFWAAREFFETQNRIIASRSIAERVVQRLGLHRDPTFMGIPADARAGWQGGSVQAAAGVLQSRLSVEPVRDTRLVLIQIRDGDPERAATLANTVADTYIEKSMEERLGSTVSALNWLGEQLDDLRNELEQSELALHQFKEDHNVLSLSMEDRQNLVAADITRYNEALTSTRLRRLELQAHLERLRTVDLDQPEFVHGGPFDDSGVTAVLRQELLQKLGERAELAQRYGDNHPAIQQIDGHIASLRDTIAAEIEGKIRGAADDLAEIRALESGLQSTLDHAHNAGLDLNLREIEYQRLNRERVNKEKLYEVVLERNTETDLTRMLQTTYVSVVDRALPPNHRISPNLTANAAGGIGAGLALGIALAFLVSRLDRRIKGLEDVEGVGLPVLGVLPRIAPETRSSSTHNRRNRGSDRPEPLPENRDVVVHTHPMSATAESCRTIRTNLTFMAADRPVRTIVITSPNPREGKTTVASNLAIALAQSGKRVLLIDTDLRRPRIHRIYGASPTSGVTSVLAGEKTLEEVIVGTAIDGLDVLPCGPIPPNPSELLHSQRFDRLVQAALERYDRLIFDSPPLSAVTDAAVLAPQLDSTIVVVKAGQTSRDAVLSAMRQLKDIGARVAGGILNDLDTTDRRYARGYYQYYYYRSTNYYQEESPDDFDSGARPSAP